MGTNKKPFVEKAGARVLKWRKNIPGQFFENSEPGKITA